MKEEDGKYLHRKHCVRGIQWIGECLVVIQVDVASLEFTFVQSQQLLIEMPPPDVK